MAPRLIKSVYTYKKISVSKMCVKSLRMGQNVSRGIKRDSRKKNRIHNNGLYLVKQKVNKFVAFLMVV